MMKGAGFEFPAERAYRFFYKEEDEQAAVRSRDAWYRKEHEIHLLSSGRELGTQALAGRAFCRARREDRGEMATSGRGNRFSK